MTAKPTGESALDGCIAALDRCLELVNGIDDDTFVYAPEGHGSVGEHLRHCIDHFDCFLRDIDCGLIEYDTRNRSDLQESSRAEAQRAVEHALDRMRRIEISAGSRAICVRQTAAPGQSPAEVGSTVERELMFLSGHTVHHLALMVLIAERAGAAPSTELGVAYSTTAHRAAQGV